jgi:hypothetical protein
MRVIYNSSENGQSMPLSSHVVVHAHVTQCVNAPDKPHSSTDAPADGLPGLCKKTLMRPSVDDSHRHAPRGNNAFANSMSRFIVKFRLATFAKACPALHLVYDCFHFSAWSCWRCCWSLCAKVVMKTITMYTNE